MMDINNDLAKEKEDDNFTDSDSDEGDEVDPTLAKMTTKQIMMAMYQKMVKLEKTKIPKIKKNLKVLEANQVEMNEKIETLENKQKESDEKVEANKEKVDEINDEVKQMKHAQTKSQQEIKALTEEVDKQSAEDERKERRMKELEAKFRKEMDEKIKAIQEQIAVINAPKFQPEGSSIHQELLQAQGAHQATSNNTWNSSSQTPASNKVDNIDAASNSAAKSAPNVFAARNAAKIAASVTAARGPTLMKQQEPRGGEPSKAYKPITILTAEDIVKEAASNIGITNVSDLTIRKFSADPNKM